MIISILALILSIINLIALYIIYKRISNNSLSIDLLNTDIDIFRNWLNYYKKEIEKDIKYLTTALNKKFNKNV